MEPTQFCHGVNIDKCKLFIHTAYSSFADSARISYFALADKAATALSINGKQSIKQWAQIRFSEDLKLYRHANPSHT